MTREYREPLAGSDVVDAPKQTRFGRRAQRVAIRFALVLGVAVCAATVVEVAYVRDVEARHAEIDGRAQHLARQNEADEATLVGYETFLETKEETEHRFEQATSAIPTRAELASVLGSVRDLATESGMRLTTFTPPSSPAEPEADGLFRFKVTAVVHGRYPSLRQFYESVAAFPRLLTIDSFSASQSPDQSGDLVATLGLTCYYKSIAPPAVAAPATTPNAPNAR